MTAILVGIELKKNGVSLARSTSAQPTQSFMVQYSSYLDTVIPHPAGGDVNVNNLHIDAMTELFSFTTADEFELIAEMLDDPNANLGPTTQVTLDAHVASNVGELFAASFIPPGTPPPPGIGVYTQTYPYADGAHSLKLRVGNAPGFARSTTGSTAAQSPIFVWLSVSADKLWESDGGGGWHGQVSASALLLQDPLDILRQEYLDLGAAASPPPVSGLGLPSRVDFVLSLGSPWTAGIYPHQLDGGLEARLNATVAAYRGQNVIDAAGNPLIVAGQQITIPATAAVAIARHVWGRALDLVPVPLTAVGPAGSTVPLSLHDHLYPTLVAAARTQGTAFVEQGSTMLTTGDPLEDHVHLQW